MLSCVCFLFFCVLFFFAVLFLSFVAPTQAVSDPGPSRRSPARPGGGPNRGHQAGPGLDWIRHGNGRERLGMMGQSFEELVN